MKRFISISLALLLIFSFIPVATMSASADENTVAKIGNTSYTSLFGNGGALAAATNGDTIKLVKDVKESGSATVNKAVTLDLAGFNAVFYGQAKVFTNTAAFTLKSSGNQSKLGYSGMLFTSSADLTVENVKTYESNSFAEYDDKGNDLLKNATWEYKRYRYDDKGKGLGNVDNYTYVANTTLVHVAAGGNYYFAYETSLSDEFAFEVFGYDSGGNIVNKISSSVANLMVTIPSGITQIGVNMFCKNDEWKDDYKEGKLATNYINKGKITPHIYVVTAPCSYSGTNNFVNVQKDNIKLKINNVTIDKTEGTTAVLNFTKAITFDVNDLTFKTQNLEQKDAITINNASSKGTIKNSTISGNNSQALKITACSSDGITLNNCNISTIGDGGRTALVVNGGKVNLINGSAGGNSASMGVTFGGGTITVDGTTFAGAKSNYSLNIASSANVTIKKAVIVKSPTTLNSQAIFLKSLAAETAIYNSATKSPETILSKSKNLNSFDKIYVDKCEHYCTSDQEDSTTCAYCETANATIQHNYTKLKYNSDSHWHICSRCDHVGAPESHKGGTATCTKKAVCEVCKQAYGEPASHDWGKKSVVEGVGCEHNPVLVAECKNCDEKYYDYSNAEANISVVQKAVDATCTEKGYTKKTVCSVCGKTIQPRTEIAPLGHDWGKEVVDVNSTFSTIGKAHKICNRCGEKYDYDLPVKAYPSKYSFAIPNANGEILTENQLKIDLASAISAVEAGGKIVLIKDASVNDLLTVNKSFTLDLQGYTLTANDNNGIMNTTADLTLISTSNKKGNVSLSGKFVTTSATVTTENVIYTATSTASAFEASAKTAVLNAENCEFNADSYVTYNSKGEAVTNYRAVRAINFTTPFTLNINNCKVVMGNDNNSIGASFNNVDLNGIVSNTSFKMQQGRCVYVSNTSSKGLTFKECSVNSSGDSGNGALFITEKSTVNVLGGSYGDNWASIATSISGTNVKVTIDDYATFQGGKNGNAALKIENVTAGNIVIKKAIIKKGVSGIINNNDTFKTAMTEGYAAFSKNVSEMTGTEKAEYVYNYASKDLTALNEFYIDTCDDWDTTATCTESGKCVYCNRDMDALGHNYKWTCDENNHWKECTRCELVEEGTVQAHTQSEEATCLHGKTCEVCGLFYGEALGHDIVKDNEGNFVYGHDETSHWKKCSRCDEHIDTQSHAGGKATCLDKAVCADCGVEYGEALGHSFTNYVSNNDATCTKDGTKTAKCDRCDETDTITDVGSMTDHRIVTDPAVSPTCITGGYTEGSHCGDCGKVIVEQRAILPDANAHKWDDGVTTPATCKEAGKIVYTCAFCGETKEIVLQINSNAHVCKTTKKAATYFAKGYKNKKVCTLCGKVISKGTEIAKKVLKVPSKSTIKSGKKKFTVKYKKVTGATHFQVRYRIKGKWTTKTFKAKKNVSKTIKKLKKGKEYSVQIRAMVKKGAKKAYSKWTKVKKIKIK